MDQKKSKSQGEDVREYPWALVSQHGEYHMHAVYDISKNRSDSKSVFEIGDYRGVCVSLCGCLLLKYTVESSHSLFLLDLASMQKFRLPPMELDHDCFFLSARPSDPECRVLFIDTIDKIFMFCRLGDSQFYRQEVADIVGEERVRSVAIFQGQVYCVTYPGKTLFRLEFTGSSIQLTQVTESMDTSEDSHWFVYHNFSLVESGEDLLLIDRVSAPSEVGHVRDFEVYKVDMEGRTWVQVNDIGDNVIFFSCPQGCSMSTVDFECQLQRNCIYYFAPCDDINLYIFDLEDGSITPYWPCLDADPEHVFFTWLMLPYRCCEDLPLNK